MFAQVELVGSNVALGVVAVVAVAYGIYRVVPKIKEKISGGGGPLQASDDSALALDVLAKIKKGIVANDVVRGGCSVLCRNMLDVADALPNIEVAKQMHTKLRELFVEFGDPTLAPTEPNDESTE